MIVSGSDNHLCLSAIAAPIDQEVYNPFDITSANSKVRDPNAPNGQAVVDARQVINFEVAYGKKTVGEAAAEDYVTFILIAQ